MKIDKSKISKLNFEKKKRVAQPQPKLNQYVDNALLSSELEKWLDDRKKCIENGDDTPQMPEYVGKCIIQIANNLSKKGNFRGYTYADEMVSDGILTVCKYIHNFDPHAVTKSGKANAFSYITMILYNAFKQRINTEKRQNYNKQKAFQMCGGFSSIDGEDYSVVTQQLECAGVGKDYLDSINAYEEAHRLKRESKRVKVEKNSKVGLFKDLK